MTVLDNEHNKTIAEIVKAYLRYTFLIGKTTGLINTKANGEKNAKDLQHTIEHLTKLLKEKVYAK